MADSRCAHSICNSRVVEITDEVFGEVQAHTYAEVTRVRQVDGVLVYHNMDACKVHM